VTNVNSTRGNGDFTIEEPTHYPFATSDNPMLQWVNNQLVKAKPSFHKKTFLKPLHKTFDFCSTCHKVHLPMALTHYKEFLRGQNHHDTFLLSGVSGHGVASFYYPDKAKENCAACHMPTQLSDDFGARPYDDSGKLAIHNHLFPGANTGVAWLKGFDNAIKEHQEFMKDVMRVDAFGIKEDGAVDGTLHAPLRPELPTLESGKDYLLESVIRTVKMGHPFTQGTVDSNEVWMDVTLKAGDRIIGRSGGMDQNREVDPWSYFVNVFMLDQDGNRINRRNPQDIRIPLYNHQIPPGAARVVHYGFRVPDGLEDHLTIELKLQYRKFDREYVEFFTKKQRPGDLPFKGSDQQSPIRNDLPITTLAVDVVTLPVKGVAAPMPDQKPRDIPEWQRWNDYGIGLFLEEKAEPRQAAEAFARVEKLGRWDGAVNQARVFLQDGRINDAVAALNRAAAFKDPAAPPWTMAWFSAQANRQQGRLQEAEQNLRSLLDMKVPERGFDFSLDYTARNVLGQTQFNLAMAVRSPTQKAEKIARFKEAAQSFERTLELDSENFVAHSNLHQIYFQLRELAETEVERKALTAKAREHGELHLRYKEDDSIRGTAWAKAREKYPAANRAAEPLTIYSLQREGAPELPTDAVTPVAAGAAAPPPDASED
jgi:tetratricopeptide (TPR) repeat protein